jgi:hypothetical protein
VRFRLVEAFRAADVLRFRAVAAFFPAATRLGDLRVVLLRAVERFRLVEAFRAADVLRFRAVAAFFPAATRFGDLRVVLLRAVVRFRLVVAFRAADVLRFRAVAAFFPAATRFGDLRVLLRAAGLVEAVFLEAVRFLVAAFLLADVAAFRAAVDLGVRVDAARVVAASVAAPSMGPPGVIVRSVRGVGRSHAGVSGCQEGSGALGASRELPSSTSFACSVLSDADSSVSSQGQSFVVRSSGDGMTTSSSARGSPVSLPELAPKDAYSQATPPQKGFRAVKSSHARSDRYSYSRQFAMSSSRSRITATPW